MPEAGPGEMLLRTIYLSLDPYMRLRMNETSHLPPFEIGKPLGGATSSVVVESNHARLPARRFRRQPASGWTTYALSDGKGMFGRPLAKLDPKRAPLSAAIWIMGSPGLTAYKGLLEVGQAQRGRDRGRVGRCGRGRLDRRPDRQDQGLPRRRHRRRARRNAAMSRTRSASTRRSITRRPPWPRSCSAACPKGIDIYFENVGGAVLDAVLPLLNNFARVPVCGNVAEYNVVERKVGPDRMPALLLAILGKRLTFRGFVVSDFMNEMQDFRARHGRAGSRRAKSATARTSATGSRTRPAPSSACCGPTISASRMVRVSPELGGLVTPRRRKAERLGGVVDEDPVAGRSSGTQSSMMSTRSASFGIGLKYCGCGQSLHHTMRLGACSTSLRTNGTVSEKGKVSCDESAD